jgi:CheY-like chemotaxis protein
VRARVVENLKPLPIDSSPGERAAKERSGGSAASLTTEVEAMEPTVHDSTVYEAKAKQESPSDALPIARDNRSGKWPSPPTLTPAAAQAKATNRPMAQRAQESSLSRSPSASVVTPKPEGLQAVPTRPASEREALEAAERMVLLEAQEIAKGQIKEQEALKRRTSQAEVTPPTVDAEQLCPSPSLSLPAGGLKILVAEGSQTIFTMFQYILGGEACQLRHVRTGCDALENIRQMRPDIIFADHCLEDRDGYAVCEELRQDPELGQLPVVLLHGSSVKLDEERYQRVGATSHLNKPFSSEELLHRIQELIAAEDDGQ